MESLFSNGVVTTLFLLICSAFIYALINEINRRWLKAKRLKVLLVYAGVLTGGAIVLSVFENPLKDAWLRASGRLAFQAARQPGDPIVIGIYPTDAFGPLHRDGLHAALEPYANQLRVVDLRASYDDMKSGTGEAPALLDRLRELITTRNVVAVVGPPVTEFTAPVIRTVWRTGRGPPLFITSAAPREAVGWTNSQVRLFRINSGIDERAAEFAQLAIVAVARGVRIVFLVEQDEHSERKTYGQLVFDQISSQLPEWHEWVNSNRISIINYPRGRVTEAISGRGAGLLDRPSIIMLLGTGRDYRAFAEANYKASDPPRRAMFGGWMNAYDSEPIFAAGNYQWPLLFEIADIDISQGPANPLAAAFHARIGQFTLARRDQAFSFDAGSVIALAYGQVLSSRRPGAGPVRADERLHRDLTARIRAMRIQGVTGPIQFNEVGQNVGLLQSQRRIMIYAFYDGPARVWRQLPDPAAVIRQMLSHPPASPATPSAPSVGPGR